jgi:hypothetical protein
MPTPISCMLQKIIALTGLGRESIARPEFARPIAACQSGRIAKGTPRCPSAMPSIRPRRWHLANSRFRRNLHRPGRRSCHPRRRGRIFRHPRTKPQNDHEAERRENSDEEIFPATLRIDPTLACYEPARSRVIDTAAEQRHHGRVLEGLLRFLPLSMSMHQRMSHAFIALRIIVEFAECQHRLRSAGCAVDQWGTVKGKPVTFSQCKRATISAFRGGHDFSSEDAHRGRTVVGRSPSYDCEGRPYAPVRRRRHQQQAGSESPDRGATRRNGRLLSAGYCPFSDPQSASRTFGIESDR